MIKLNSKALRSNRQVAKRTPSFPESQRYAERENHGENHNFDFFLKQLIWIFNLNSKVQKLLSEELENRTTQFPELEGIDAKSKEGMRLGFLTLMSCGLLDQTGIYRFLFGPV
ncbi:hypothetical protein GQ457_11G026510 [Hibiscus cannabinus]